MTPRSDGHIRLLPLHVANKIAAGEVVERPASVLKELLENALDAGSTRIDVTVTAGGRKLVSVRDDGCGMSREDALLSLERQATSKIRDVDDIERIATLGFRGEAIPSIASVSRFTLTTRPAADEAGTRLVVNAGTLAEVKDCGAPPGTCVEVRDLFCNVPARRKFLRTFATEEGHIRAVFTVHAIAHPDVGFSLALDGRDTYSFAPGATLEERLADLFGAAFAESLLPVDATSGAVRVHGYVERPGRADAVRRDQFIFINGRPASAPAIAFALREAYPRAAADTRPAVFLFIDLPPEQVDVNVHPAKREVRFRRAADVREAVITALTAALKPETTPPAPEPLPPPPLVLTPPPCQPTFAVPFSTPPVPSPTVPPQPSLPSLSPHPSSLVSPPSSLVPCPSSLPPPAPPPEERAESNLWRWFRYLAQTSTGWVLLETDAGLVTLNPRAARERIAYENLLDSHAARKPASQTLLIPETVPLAPLDSARIRNFQAELAAMGFVLEEFGRDVWKVDAVPALLDGLPVPDVLASIASDIAENGAKRGGARWREELVARGVAHSFSRTNLTLTPEGGTRLVEQLARTRMPYVCPRGRPTMIFKSNAELTRAFTR